ncbi:LON peptidase substrate-binding domain-containing protein [uncultured Jatrophihabitans sp.]|uniref:LON peptidase substrate-binding domain-containing protein n=1 Tax=uncultured Jatrophihabitans sp. TaxID=1610747 RepID=UPI0035CA529C
MAPEHALIPLFPLSHVLLPGMPLPLHIFEQRYRQLLDDIAETPDGPVFGVVALRTGTEAENPGVAARGDAPDVERVGTLAEILEIEREPDGAADLLAVGTRRFTVEALVPTGKPYLRAEVTFLDESDGGLTRAQEVRARELMDVYDSYLLRLAGRGTGSELPNDASMLAYQIAARLPLPPAEKQALLGDLSTSERLTRLARLLRREIALLQGTRSIAVSPAVLRMGAGSN